MKPFHHSFKILVLLTGLIISTVFSTEAANRYSVASGIWASTARWSATSGGAPGASIPVAGDVVFIENGYTITIGANAACATLNIATGSTLIVGGFNFAVSANTSVSGTITHNNTSGTKTYTGNIIINSGGLWNETVAEIFAFADSLQNDGTFTASTGVHTLAVPEKLLAEQIQSIFHL